MYDADAEDEIHSCLHNRVNLIEKNCPCNSLHSICEMFVMVWAPVHSLWHEFKGLGVSKLIDYLLFDEKIKPCLVSRSSRKSAVAWSWRIKRIIFV